VSRARHIPSWRVRLAIQEIARKQAESVADPKPQYFTWSNALKFFRRLKPDEAKTK
jgi:hypothetical protein